MKRMINVVACMLVASLFCNGCMTILGAGIGYSADVKYKEVCGQKDNPALPEKCREPRSISGTTTGALIGIALDVASILAASLAIASLDLDFKWPGCEGCNDY